MKELYDSVMNYFKPEKKDEEVHYLISEKELEPYHDSILLKDWDSIDRALLGEDLSGKHIEDDSGVDKRSVEEIVKKDYSKFNKNVDN